MQTVKSRTIAALGALVATVVSVTAVSPARAESVEVRYHDLDLGSAAGRATLHRRIRNAAAEVCGPYQTLTLFRTRDCRSSAISRAEAGVAAAQAAAAATGRMASN